MAGEVRVTIGANVAVTTSGVEDAKRQAAEVKAATEGVSASARDAGAAMQDAMRDAAEAAREAADALRRGAALPERGPEFPPNRPPIITPLAPATAPTATATGAGASALAYDPRTHAHRASTMLHGIEAHLAGGVTSEAQLVQLEARARRAGYYVGAAQEGGLPEQQTRDLVEHLEAVEKALAANRDAIQENTRESTSLAPREPDDESSATNRLLGSLLGEVRGLGGAGLTQFGMLGRLLGGAGGIVGGAALAGGAAYAGWNLLRRTLTNWNQVGREELVGMADLGRQYESSDNPLAWFRQTSGAYQGFTDPDIARLGYSGTEAGAFMARLDLPGGGEDPTRSAIADTRSGLAFARATGLQEDSVAGFIRALGLGGIERGSSERSLALVREAMREGVREGVSTSDTFRNVEQALTGIFRGGANLTEAGIAFQTGLATAAARSGNRQWQGDQGAANLDRLQAAMVGGGDLGMELALFNRTGGFTAADLGLTGEQAVTYEDIRGRDRVSAMRLAVDLARANPAVMERFARALQSVLGDNPVLMLHYLRQFGLTGQAALEYLGPQGIATLVAQGVAEGERAAKGDAFSDAQRGNVLAAETLAIQTAERDVALVGSLASLGLTGGGELSMRRFGIDAQRHVARLVRGLGGRDPFAPFDLAPGRVGTGHGFVFDEFTPDERTNPGSFTVRDRSELAALQMASGIEATRGDQINMSPLAAARGGAFGLTQILASNFVGPGAEHAGWDKWFMGLDASHNVRRLMANADLDLEDPIPDDVAAGGAPALQEWYLGLTSDQREAIDALVLGITSAKLQQYASISREQYGVRDPAEAHMRAIAAWYTGPFEYGAHSVLDPAFQMHEDNPFFRRNQSDGGIPLRDYLKKFGYEFEEPTPTTSPEGNAGGMTLTVRFEGLERITVEGATAARQDAVRDAARDFVQAIVGPTSHRGA